LAKFGIWGVGAAARLDGGLGEAQAVDAVLDGLHRPRHGLLLHRDQLARLEVHFVVGRVDGAEHPTGELGGHQVPEVAGLLRRDAVDVDLDGIGLIDGLRVVPVDAGVVDAALAQVVLKGLDGAIGFGLDSILHLDLQHQMASALQIEPQMDVLLKIGLQLFLIPW